MGCWELPLVRLDPCIVGSTDTKGERTEVLQPMRAHTGEEQKGHSLIRNAELEVLSEHDRDTRLFAQGFHAGLDGRVPARPATDYHKGRRHAPALNHASQPRDFTSSRLEWPIQRLSPGGFNIGLRQGGSEWGTVGGREAYCEFLARLRLLSLLHPETG